MKPFVDSSALVKRYVEEPGSNEVTDLLEKHPDAIVSWLAYAETLAAFKRLFTTKVISLEEFEATRSQFLEDWLHFTVAQETLQLEKILDNLLTRQLLRGMDSIQLASAIYQSEKGLNLEFVTSDRRLANAAKEEKLKVYTPGI